MLIINCNLTDVVSFLRYIANEVDSLYLLCNLMMQVFSSSARFFSQIFAVEGWQERVLYHFP